MENLYIKGFNSWMNESQNNSNELQEIESLLEGRMSEIDIIAQEAKSFEAFIEDFKSYAIENKINITVDKDTENWLKILYDQAKQAQD